MSALKKGESFSEFIWKRYLTAIGVVVAVVFAAVMRMEYALLSRDVGFLESIDSISFYLSFFVILTNMAFAYVNVRGQWIDSFPKYMNVHFRRRGAEIKHLGTNGNPIPVVCEADIRSLAQQYGKSRNNDTNLPLQVDYAVVDEVEMQNRRKIYTVTMSLRPQNSEHHSARKTVTS
ncbi:hypothetical protein [Desulfobaculum senezii]